MKLLGALDGTQFWATAKQEAAIDTLLAANKGGIARVINYVATSGRISPETANYTFTSRFSISRFYERKLAQLQDLSFKDVLPYALMDAKLKDVYDNAVRNGIYDGHKSLLTIFTLRKNDTMTSLRTTLDGLRDDARRQAHDRCYTRMGDGCKVHFVTEKGGAGTVPVDVDGHPVCATVMVDMLVLNKDVVVPGVYKPVNSGLPVRMGNAIANAITALYVSNIKFCTLSLKDDNFEEVRIGGSVITEAEEIHLRELA